VQILAKALVILIILLDLKTPAKAAEPNALQKNREAPAATKTAPSPPVQTTTTTPPVSSTNTISFEDELIEGMNQNPLDSLTQVSGKTNELSDRLYRLKTNFRPEIRRLSGETGYCQ
jgi:hypothetical protein